MAFDGLTIEDLEQDLAAANEHLANAAQHKDRLEAILKRRKHAHATLDGIEEAVALCVSILHDEELATALRDQKFRRLREVLDKVRQSPTAYRDDGRPTLPNLRQWLDDFEEYREARSRKG